MDLDKIRAVIATANRVLGSPVPFTTLSVTEPTENGSPWLLECTIGPLDIKVTVEVPDKYTATTYGLPNIPADIAGHDTHVRLSARHMKLLRLASSGLPAREIAAELHYSLSTVKRLFRQIYNALGLPTGPGHTGILLAQAVKWYVLNGNGAAADDALTG